MRAVVDLSRYDPDPLLLRDRVILVTGAAHGIGRAAAQAFAGHGAAVILLDRDVPALESVYDAIEQDGGPQPAIYPMDLEGASVADYDDLARRIEEAFGRLDGLLHNAAMLGDLTPIASYDLRLLQRVMQVNFYAPLLLTRACLPLLMKSVDASVLFTSDAVGRRAQAYWGAYAVSKSATEALMQILADELEVNSPVRVNSIDPGPVQTRMRLAAFPAESPTLWPRPAEVMVPYLFLMGPDSRGVTSRAFSAQQDPSAIPNPDH